MHMPERKTSDLALGAVFAALVLTTIIGGGAVTYAEESNADGEAPAAVSSAVPDAAPIVTPPETLFDYFRKGGKLMWAILACSVVVVAFAFERMAALKRERVIDNAAYREIVRLAEHEGPANALSYARSNNTPMARVLAGVLTCAGSPRAELGTVVEDAGGRELWELQRNTKPLGIISNIAPLLGLLGTVFGIIRAFSDVAREGAIGNPKMLAGGIYEALITTAAGLSVAIPAFLLYHFFRGKADALVREIEEKALHLIAVMSGEPGEPHDLDDTRAGAENINIESA
jgi:biopolymer transport protein ExbB